MLRFFTFGLLALSLVAGCDRSVGIYQGEKLHPVAVASKPQKIATEKPCCTILADVVPALPTSTLVEKPKNCPLGMIFAKDVPKEDRSDPEKIKKWAAEMDSNGVPKAYMGYNCP